MESNKFSDAGLDVEFRDYPGGTGAMTAALASGEVDMALLLFEGAVADLIRRRQTKLIKVYVQSPLIWGIHVAADSEIHSVEEIKDRRYAISRFGSGSHLMAIVDASERGWESDDLEFQIVRNLQGARTALASDEADIFLWEQFTTQPFVDNGEFRRVGLRKTKWPAFVVAAETKVLREKESAIKRALDLINEQCSSLMKNSNASEMISKRYDLELDQVKEWISLTEWSVDYECPADAIRNVLRYLNRLEIINAPEASVDDVWMEIEG